MHHCLLTFEYPPLSGGISRFCYELHKNMEFDMEVVHQGHSQISSRRPWRESSALKYLKQARPELTVSAIWYPEGVIGNLTSKANVILAHGLELLPRKNRLTEIIWRQLRQNTLSNASLVVANSLYTANLVREQAKHANVVSIPLGVDTERFRPFPANKIQARDTKPFRILTIARLFEYKGVDTVLESLSLLPNSVLKNIVYQIGGTGPAESTLRERIRQLGLENQVEWLGMVPESEMAQIYSSADLFVMMSRESLEQQVVEGFGLTFLESQACGTPVIGSRTGGIPDAIHENCGGWLLPQDDPQSLSRKVLELYENPDILTKQSELARKRALENTWAIYADRFVQTLRSQGLVR